MWARMRLGALVSVVLLGRPVSSCRMRIAAVLLDWCPVLLHSTSQKRAPAQVGCLLVHLVLALRLPQVEHALKTPFMWPMRSHSLSQNLLPAQAGCCLLQLYLALPAPQKAHFACLPRDLHFCFVWCCSMLTLVVAMFRHPWQVYRRWRVRFEELALSGGWWLHLCTHVASQKRLCRQWVPSCLRGHPKRALGLSQTAHRCGRRCVYRRPPSGRGFRKSLVSWVWELYVSQLSVAPGPSSDVSEWFVSIMPRGAPMRTFFVPVWAVVPVPMVGLWLTQYFMTWPFFLQAKHRLPGAVGWLALTANDTAFLCRAVCPSSSDVSSDM